MTRTQKADGPKRWKWWHWTLGLLLLLAICDDDDDENPRDRGYCYEFDSGETRCFKEPLPGDKHCYIMQDDAVYCYDQPLN